MNNISIAFVSTGDEILTGKVLDTNIPYMANRCKKLGFHIMNHFTVGDRQQDLNRTLALALLNSDIVITCGGLGPTSDDRTRYAISEISKITLIEDEPTWLAIQNRLRLFNLVIHENNRAQAMFPINSTILPNPNGTAAGFITIFDYPNFSLNHSQNSHSDFINFLAEKIKNDISNAPLKCIISLPGPPKECLKMFDEQVISFLGSLPIPERLQETQWKLIGISESALANLITPILKEYNDCASYCWNYPYIDFAVTYPSHLKENMFMTEIENALQPYVAGRDILTASQQLIQCLQERKITIYIEDAATGGQFFSTLNQPSIHTLFCEKGNAELHVKISGLDAYWQQHGIGASTQFQVTLSGKINSEHVQKVSYHGPQVKDYAVEYASLVILKKLQNS